MFSPGAAVRGAGASLPSTSPLKSKQKRLVVSGGLPGAARVGEGFDSTEENGIALLLALRAVTRVCAPCLFVLKCVTNFY